MEGGGYLPGCPIARITLFRVYTQVPRFWETTKWPKVGIILILRPVVCIVYVCIDLELQGDSLEMGYHKTLNWGCLFLEGCGFSVL